MYLTTVPTEQERRAKLPADILEEERESLLAFSSADSKASLSVCYIKTDLLKDNLASLLGISGHIEPN